MSNSWLASASDALFYPAPARTYDFAMPQVWLNDQFLDESSAAVSVRDTGLLHAAGVFTTMRSYDGKVFRLPQHLRRLRDSCEAFFIPLTASDAQLESAVSELLQRNQLTDARLRLTITRGTARHDPLHGMHLHPTALLTCAPIEPYPAEFYDKGMTVMLLDEQKLNPYDLQAGHKTLNYFSRLAGLREANRRGAGEALWFDVHNQLQSGSISNVFVVKNNVLITPPIKSESRDVPSSVLPGITRAAVMEIAADHRIETRTEPINVNQLLDADEIFLTNSIMQIMPICRIERKAVGKDKPGPITLDLSARLTRQISHAS